MANHEFQTEVSRLLQLIIHSLYSHKEIFLRELISNASDALDKLKYLCVAEDSYKALSFEPLISLSYDKGAKTLKVSDSGLGMNEHDMIEHLGTIARSGTRAFLDKLSGDSRKDSNLIGQFGVGFYSAFMVANRIEVLSRKAGESEAYLWSSDGSSGFEISKAERPAFGTDVILHLNDEGIEYADRWRLKELVKRYSDHIAFPIELEYEDEEWDAEAKAMKSKGLAKERVNAAAALWKRPKSELKEEDYKEFYKTLAHGDEEPLRYIHTKAEGSIEYTTLFYIPKKAPFDMYQVDYRPGVKLYVKRVFITDEDKELIPPYLRFVRGIIDSEDLPLNVSREILQQNRILQTIKTASVKKILAELKDMAENDKEAYGLFVAEFNRPLKEGLYGDYANREALLELVRFKSSQVDGWVSLSDYKSRMLNDQKAIYYLALSRGGLIKNSPLLEAYRRKGIEVLLMDDDIDQIVAPSIGRYGELELKAIDRAGAEDELGQADDQAQAEELKPVFEAVKGVLGEEVKEVRASKRLTDSPSCVVVDSSDPGFEMRRIMESMGRHDMPESPPILELNPVHPLVQRLKASMDKPEYLENLAKVLLAQAYLAEGAPLKDPADFVKRLNALLS